MTIDMILDALRARDAQLYVANGQLRYLAASPLAATDPIRMAISEHRTILTELLTFAPGSRCVFSDCYRLIAEGSQIACADHVRVIHQETAALAGHLSATVNREVGV